MFEPVVYSYNSSGEVKVFGSSKSKTVFVRPFTSKKSFSKFVITWIGNGTAFEIANGTERIIAPWVNSGPLRAGGDA
jgi:hypothetical protein